MSAALQKPGMTVDEFFLWAEAQEERYEFDGIEPVLMTGGTALHSRINHNLWRALDRRLDGAAFEMFGPDAGLATVGATIRYPDAMVCPAGAPNQARSIPGAIIVFETLSPTSGHIDRIVKPREYHAVASIRRYMIVEYEFRGITVLHRPEGQADWTAGVLSNGETLALPEIGIELPLDELYGGIELP